MECEKNEITLAQWTRLMELTTRREHAIKRLAQAEARFQLEWQNINDELQDLLPVAKPDLVPWEEPAPDAVHPTILRLQDYLTRDELKTSDAQWFIGRGGEWLPTARRKNQGPAYREVHRAKQNQPRYWYAVTDLLEWIAANNPERMAEIEKAKDGL